MPLGILAAWVLARRRFFGKTLVDGLIHLPLVLPPVVTGYMLLILPGIITGSILAFARALSEFGATITFVSNIRGETQTLPLALYTMTQVPEGEVGAMRLCIISVVVALLALTASEVLAKRLNAIVKG